MNEVDDERNGRGQEPDKKQRVAETQWKPHQCTLLRRAR